MQPDEFRRHGHAIIDWIADYQANIRDYPVIPKCAPGDLIDALPATGPQAPETMEQILRDFEALIVPGVTHWNHPRFHSFFAISSSPPGVLAETLAAALNMQHMLWKSGPAGTELEQVTLAWLIDWMGLGPGWFGEIFDTASVSTLHGIAAAREMVAPGSRAQGNPAGLTVYCSQWAHTSVDKACIMLGVGLDNLRRIEADGQYRLKPAALAQAIREDRAAGRLPICIVPTVGTTGVTSVDPVAEVVRIARAENMWVHVDAAYGGAAAIVPEFRHYLDGVDGADSMVVNPHKWLFTPIDLSCFYTRRPDVVRRAFSLVPDYLQYQEDPRLINLMDYGLPLGRRFRSLKLWFAMRYYGHEGFMRMIRNHVAWAHRLADLIRADERFEMAAPVTMGLVCFRLKASDDATRALVEAINDSGFAFLSQTTVDGKFTVRWAIGTFGCTWEDVDAVWQRILTLVP